METVVLIYSYWDLQMLLKEVIFELDMFYFLGTEA